MNKTKLYRVVWEIDIEAESAIDAAREALIIQRDKESTATVFTVKERKERDDEKNQSLIFISDSLTS